MTTRLIKHALVLVAVMAVGCLDSARATDERSAQDAETMAALKKAGPRARLEIYPVRVLEKPDRNVADVLGLVLESSGMSALEASDVAFAPTSAGDWPETVKQFGEFVAKAKNPSDFTLYAEFLGEPKKGPTEVRWVIADSGGKVMISDRQMPGDRDFKRIVARDPDPMGCSVLVAERLFAMMKWKKSPPSTDAPGKFAQLWAAKSGIPDRAERARMEGRLKDFKSGLKSSSIAVYPARLNGKPDADTARRVADAVSRELGCGAKVMESAIEIDLQPSSNQQKRLWDLARGFRDQLRKSPAETGYALFVEYMIDPQGGPAHAVHFVLCDRSGEWVIVDFQNNQQPVFMKVKPVTAEDCDRVVMKRLADYVK